jgi:transcriptional regulator with XRE-family HTH domain
MNQTQRETFGSYLKALRTAKKLTQREAAEQAGISNPYLTQLEKGQRNPPSRDILSRLAEVYGEEEDRILRAAGYVAEQEARRAAGSLDMRRLNWAFDIVISDPNFALGTRMNRDQITPAVKAWAIELYLRTQDRQILKPDEIAALKEIIGYEERTDESLSSGAPTE